MRKFRNILWVFGEDDRKAALEWMTPLAKDPQTRLTVVAVIDQVPSGVPGSTRIAEPPAHQDPQTLAIEREKEHLTHSMEEIHEQGLRPDTQVLVGVPFLEITRQVVRKGHDLVIVSAKGICGVSERLLGSPALHLMRTCPCPVWVLRSRRGQSHGGILAALDAEGGDNADLNRKILDLAYGLAQCENMEIHVYHPRLMDEENVPWPHPGVGKLRCEPFPLENRHRDQKVLDGRRAECDPVSRTMHFYYLRGAPAPLICQLAHDRQVDVIIMGTACRPGANRCAQGSIAETVLHQADCSVLSVKSDRFVSPVTA
jgi:universal stress protein E